MRLTALIIVKNVDPVPAAMQQAAVNRHSAAVLIVTIVSRYAGRTCACGGEGRDFGLGAFYCYDSTLPVLAGAAGERGRGSERARACHANFI